MWRPKLWCAAPHPTPPPHTHTLAGVVPAWMAGHDSLTDIDLKGNQLTKLPDAWEAQPATTSAPLQFLRCVWGGGGGARRGGEGGGGSQSASGWVVPHRRAQQVSERGACLL